MNIYLKIKTFVLSFFILKLNNVNLHNLDKFFQIKKIWFNIKLDSIDGDYIEFGIFKGKSLYHSIKAAQKLNLNNKVYFWGLDSFEGFPVQNHNFYLKQNFIVSEKKVRKFFRKFKNTTIVSGFFNETLNNDLKKIESISFAFVDCDIFESAEEAFKFLEPRITRGGFIMIDDFTSIDKNGLYIAKSFYKIFNYRNYILFDTYSNGQTYRIMD